MQHHVALEVEFFVYSRLTSCCGAVVDLPLVLISLDYSFLWGAGMHYFWFRRRAVTSRTHKNHRIRHKTVCTSVLVLADSEQGALRVSESELDRMCGVFLKQTPKTVDAHQDYAGHLGRVTQFCAPSCCRIVCKMLKLATEFEQSWFKYIDFLKLYQSLIPFWYFLIGLRKAF